MTTLTETERLIAAQLDDLLAPSRTIVRDAAGLARLCSAHASTRDSVVAEVQNSLLARVADEVAGVCCLASFGYEMQALGLAASAFELGHLSAFIGSDERRAGAWRTWTDYRRMPWNVSEITKGAIRNLARPGVTHQRQYLYYQFACLAKHGNALVQAETPVAESDVMRLLNADPTLGGGQGNRAFFGMFIGAISALLASDVYVKFNAPDDTQLQGALAELAPRWNTLARAFEEWRKSNRDSKSHE